MKRGLSIKRFIVLLFVLSQVAQPAYALDGKFDPQFFQLNGIENYNPESVVCTSSTDTGGDASLGSGDQKRKIWDWLISKGMSEQGAAGIMGNMQVESGFNPFRLQVSSETYDTLVDDSGYNRAFGLVQWDGSRRVSVLKYIATQDESYKQYVAAKYGASATDYSNAPEDINKAFLTMELDFMYKESTPGGGRPTTWKLMLEADTPEKAADKFEEVFEGSVRGAGGPHTTAAKQIFGEFSGTGSSPSAVDSTSCGDSGGSGGAGGPVGEGGLTQDQAKRLMINYGANKNNDTLNTIGASYWNMCSPGNHGSNCVSFSRFFINKFSSKKAPTPMGDGGEVVGNMAAAGFETGSQPKVYAVFSMSSSSSYGHTGVVLGIQGDTAIVGHASCGRGNDGIGGAGNGTLSGNGSGFIGVGKLNRSGGAWYAGGVPTKFAYPPVDVAKIQSYIQE